MFKVYGHTFEDTYEGWEEAKIYVAEFWERQRGKPSKEKKRLKLSHLKNISKEGLSLKPFDFRLTVLNSKEFFNISRLMRYLSHSGRKQDYDIGNITEHFNKKDWIECPFFEGHLFKVVKGNFISFNPKTWEGFAFDFMDILKLYEVSLDSFVKLNNIKIQIAKSRDIEKAELILATIRRKGFHKKYPHLNKYIKNYLPVLDKFTQIFLEGLNKIDGEYIYDIKVSNSLEYLLLMFHTSGIEINKGLLSRVLNAFCLLGLYEKVLALKDSDYKTDHIYNINYFKVNADFEKAEIIASKLLECRLSVAKLSRDAVSEVLGMDSARAVFQSHKYKLTEDDRLSPEDDELQF